MPESEHKILELEKNYEIARLMKESGNFISALEILHPLAEQFHSLKKYDMYLKCMNDLIRIYAERSDQEKINELKETLQDHVLKENIELTPYAFYTLGVAAACKGQVESSLEYFQKALALSMQKESKKDMCYAIMGLAIVYSHTGKYQEALQELSNLKIFFEVLPITELKVSSQILHGIILRKMHRFEQALEVLWGCYEHLKIEKCHYLYLHLLYAIGVTYMEQGEIELSKIYLQLLKKSLDPQNFVRLFKDTDRRLTEVGCNQDEYDIVFDISNNAVTERKIGRVDFNNQFILLELLHLLMKYPGQTFSKEVIVKKIWNQEYSPAMHDNKIYVTIKRLRKMIEPEIDKPKYIFRAKNGYYFNRACRVRFDG